MKKFNETNEKKKSNAKCEMWNAFQAIYAHCVLSLSFFYNWGDTDNVIKKSWQFMLGTDINSTQSCYTQTTNYTPAIDMKWHLPFDVWQQVSRTLNIQLSIQFIFLNLCQHPWSNKYINFASFFFFLHSAFTSSVFFFFPFWWNIS